MDNTILQGFKIGGFEHGDNISNFDTDVQVRGFPVPTLTNGFRTQVRVDTVALGRIEPDGGPGSLLYGIGAISGITNNLTKLPLPEPRHAASMAVGTNEFYRFTLDSTGPLAEDLLGGSIGYRFTASFTNEGAGLRSFRVTESCFVSFFSLAA